MKKALIVSTVARQFFLFEAVNIQIMRELGYEVHGAANTRLDDPERLSTVRIALHHIDIQRSPLSLANAKAFWQLLSLLREHEFDLVHCHAPMGGVVGRLAARAAGISPIIYTAHGFHFFKGAPLKNWLMYFPMEWLLSRFTDLIITINGEDYSAAKRMHAREVAIIPGVGVRTGDFLRPEDCRSRARRELGLPPESIVLLSVGELIPRKGHETTLKSLARIDAEEVHLLICGKGVEEQRLRNLAIELGVDQRVHFLGFRSDIPEIAAAADVYVSAAHQEGLPVAGVEAMAAGLPLLCSTVRGNVDLLEEGGNGFGFEADDAEGLADRIRELIQNPTIRTTMSKRSRELSYKFDADIVAARMRGIYGAALCAEAS